MFLAGTRTGPRKGPSTRSFSPTTGAASLTSLRVCPSEIEHCNLLDFLLFWHSSTITSGVHGVFPLAHFMVHHGRPGRCNIEWEGSQDAPCHLLIASLHPVYIQAACTPVLVSLLPYTLSADTLNTSHRLINHTVISRPSEYAFCRCVGGTILRGLVVGQGMPSITVGVLNLLGVVWRSLLRRC